MLSIRPVLVALFGVLTFLPAFAAAHTRWFAPANLPPYVTAEPTGAYLAVWGSAALIIVLIGFALERMGVLSLDFIKPQGAHAFDRAAASFSMVVGAFLLIAGTHEYLFSPNLSFTSGISQIVIVIQVIVGIALLVGFYERIAALFLIGLWFTVFASSGYVAALEDVWVLSTGLFILIMGNDYFDIFPVRALRRHVAFLRPYALPILRLGTGLTLFVLGFSEKILHPEFGVYFLSLYHWNFMQLLGVNWYSDYLFTLSAGSVESLFGLIFILGFVTRLNALVLAVFFTIPLFILGPIELAGHLPHFAAVVLILLFGAGEKLKVPVRA